MAAQKGYDHVIQRPRISRGGGGGGGRSEMDRDPEGQSGRYYMTSLQTILQVCWNVLLEEKLFPTL